MSYVFKFSDELIAKKKISSERPFNVKFNFTKMIEFWEGLASKKEGNHLALLAKPVLDEINKVPELRAGFSDVTLLEKHQDLLQKLFYPLFPSITTNNEIRTAAMPFAPIWFNMTERFKNIIKNAGGADAVQMRVDSSDMMYIYACVFILNFKYGANINFDQTFFFDIPNDVTGVLHHYRVHYNAEFSDFTANDNFVPLSPEEIKELTDNFENIELWKEKMPPNSHNFEGFAIMKLFDVTMEEAISNMKYNLLSKDAFLSKDTVEKIRLNLSSLLKIPNIKLGVASYDIEMGVLKPMGKGFWNSISLTNYKVKKAEDAFCEVSFRHVMKNKKDFAISLIDENWKTHSRLAQKLVDQGLKSYAALPLLYNDEIIGVLEVGSEEEGAISSVTTKMLEVAIPLFTTALQRSQDEYETKLEAIIQEKCTAIHPSVSWRFLEAAAKLLENQRQDGSNDMEEIVFPEVYPLYGQSDIKGSSTERNLAIQGDMIEQLSSANKVLAQAIKEQPLPIYKKMEFRINTYIDRVKKGLDAGDEIKVLEFLKKEIYPTFKHLKKTNSKLAKAVKEYNKLLDEELGIVYNKRKDYEYSVATLNDSIADYIEREQRNAQKMFPHYFEKYQTDGVEHDMYIGQSLVNNKSFHKTLLHNLRIWQLMVICESENVAFQLKENLPIPLRVASLVLVHSNPITIKFRTEEKRFDVEGAYNVRYEIIKKRIDKAIIKGTTERLTQVGKIAIVYSQESEAKEYLSYLNYLESINYIHPEIENLELQEMQGVSGMKALRVSIVFNGDELTAPSKKKLHMKTNPSKIVNVGR